MSSRNLSSTIALTLALTAGTAAADAPTGNGPTWSLINRAPKQNPRGWRSKGEGARSGPISYRDR